MASFEVHQTDRSRPGRLFAAVQEAGLYPAALEAARTLPGAGAGILVIPEMFGPQGVPDFLVIVGGRRPLAERLASGIPPILGELDAIVVGSLHLRRSTSLQSLAQQLRISDSNVRTRLMQLKKVGAVIEISPDRFIRHHALSPGGTLYALEAKVRDWQQAVRQSRGYRTWANNYVLVLGPLGAQARAAAVDVVASDEAGLYVDGKWILKPQRRSPDALRRFIGFEHLVASLEGYHPSDAMN